jgi:hypothetical protein
MTSANDPRPPREEATALSIEHLDDSMFDFDDLETSELSAPDVEATITSEMRNRRLARSGLVNDYSIPDHESEADCDVKSEPGLEDSESEDEDGDPKRGHVQRCVATIEATVQDKDDVTEEDKQDQLGTKDRDVSAVDTAPRTAPRRPQGKPPLARKIGNRRFRMARGITVDSGAADNVMPRRLVIGKMNRGRIRPSEASRAGVHYVAANNGRIKNEGEVDFKFNTSSGDLKSMCFQVAEVNKALAAVSALVDSNHRVVFDKDMKTGADISFIIDKKTNHSTKMRRERNVWVIDAWIDEEEPGMDFARQE